MHCAKIRDNNLDREDDDSIESGAVCVCVCLNAPRPAVLCVWLNNIILLTVNTGAECGHIDGILDDVMCAY